MASEAMPSGQAVEALFAAPRPRSAFLDLTLPRTRTAGFAGWFPVAEKRVRPPEGQEELERAEEAEEEAEDPFSEALQEAGDSFSKDAAKQLKDLKAPQRSESSFLAQEKANASLEGQEVAKEPKAEDESDVPDVPGLKSALWRSSGGP